MKLSPICIRDILLHCETNISFGPNLSWNPISLDELCNSLPKYSKEELAYSLLLLDEANYIESQITNYDGGILDIYVYRLTYPGHEFLDTIKSDTIWKKIQAGITTLGSASLPVIQSLGSHFAVDFLTHL